MKAIQITRFDKKLNQEVTKNYYPVSERVKDFRENADYSGYSVVTEIVNLTDDSVTIQAKILNVEGVIKATGTAHEEKSWGMINAQSMVENCETSAVGRALAFLGIGISDDIASADEMSKVKDVGDAGFQQISMIEGLLKNASIPDREKKQISMELITFDATRANKCISYLKSNQVNKKLDEELTDVLRKQKE